MKIWQSMCKRKKLNKMKKMKIKIGGQFSGVGAFDFALKKLGIDFLNVYQAEWDKYARQSYLANHNAPKYYIQDVNDTPIQDITDKHGSLDLAMFSPPCQSFSLAGKRQGKDDLKGRGILFFNSLEFIQINRPRFFIFENVKGLLSADGGRTFGEWVRLLGGKSVNGTGVLFSDENAVPYHIYYQVLNAKHYGVPQNRERVFIVGILDDQDNVFTWPKKTPLVKKLKDVLQSEVDDKYYLSEKMIEGMKNTSYISRQRLLQDKDYVDTLCVKVGFINQDSQASKVYSSAGLSPNICAGTHGYANGYINDTPKVIHQLTGGKWDKTHEQSGIVYDIEAIAPTIHTMGGGNQEPKIAVMRGRNPDNVNDRTKGCPSVQMLEINENGTSNALTTVQKDNLVVENRIRKLTPTECFRLMGMYDFKKVCSDSQLYKQAGNSIVVDVLAAIISKLKL